MNQKRLPVQLFLFTLKESSSVLHPVLSRVGKNRPLTVKMAMFPWLSVAGQKRLLKKPVG